MTCDICSDSSFPHASFCRGRTAFITGAASGIGYGIARALARHGVSVALGDIEEGALDRAVSGILDLGARAIGVPVDVSDRRSVAAAAERVARELGPVHFLVNNAGVAYNAQPLWSTPYEAVDWSIGVNIHGVINGVKEFVPAMIEHGHGGHIVNTSSIGGFQVRPSAQWHQGLYAATKFAVVALSEGLRQDLQPHGIGVSILAPASVATSIASSDRNRQARYGGPAAGGQRPEVAAMLESGMSPDEVGLHVLDAMANDDPYVFTHSAERDVVARRQEGILAAFDDVGRRVAFARAHGA